MLQIDTVYAVKKDDSARGGGLPAQIGSANFHTKLQCLYKYSDRSNIERDYIRLVRE